MPYRIGKEIFGKVGPQVKNLFGLGFGAELFYSFIIITCSLLIYFGTRQLYNISSHKGIKYFRQAFLFFAIAYFFRAFIKFIGSYLNANDILDFSLLSIGPKGILAQFFFMYFSSMAIFYLLYSFKYKKWENSHISVYFFHILALVISIISVISRNLLIYFGLNFFLLFLVFFIIYSSKREKESKSLFLIYILLSVFLVLNILDTIVPNYFQGFQLLIYMASTGVFLVILYKVLINLGSK